MLDTLRLSRLAASLAWSAQPFLVGSIFLLLVVQAALPPLQLWFSQAIVDRLTFELGLVSQAGAVVRAFPLAAWIGLAAVAVALAQFLQPLSSTMYVMAGDRITGLLLVKLMRATNRWQGLARFEDPQIADDLEYALLHVQEGGGLELIYAGTRAVLALLTTVGIVIVLAALHPLVPLAIVFLSLPALTEQWKFGKRMGSHLYWRASEARRLEYNRAMMVIPEPAKDVRLYGLNRFFLHRYSAIFDRTITELDSLRRAMVPRVTVAGVLAAAAVGGLWIWLSWQIFQGEETLGAFILYGGAAALLYRQLFGIGSDLSGLPVTLASLDTFQNILEAPPDLPESSQPKSPPQTIREGIVFENVRFTYPGNDSPVLEDVSFTLKPGESTALVGQNGAGKTTIIKLLLRFYDPTGGRILLDGVDLRDYDLADLRRTMGAIFQDFVQYELTAEENIGLGQVEALGDRPRILAAAEKIGSGRSNQPVTAGPENASWPAFWRSRTFRRRVAETCSRAQLHA